MLPLIVLGKVIIEIIGGVIVYGIFMNLFRIFGRFFSNTVFANGIIKKEVPDLDKDYMDFCDAMNEKEDAIERYNSMNKTGEGIDEDTLNSLYNINFADYEKKFIENVESMQQDESLVENETDELCTDYLKFNENLVALEKQLKDFKESIPYKKDSPKYQAAFESDEYKNLIDEIDEVNKQLLDKKKTWITRHILRDMYIVNAKKIDDAWVENMVYKQMEKAALTNIGAMSRGNINAMRNM